MIYPRAAARLSQQDSAMAGCLNEKCGLLRTKEGAVQCEMNGDTCGIAQGNRQYPFQVGREGIDPPRLPHEGDTSCRADSRIGEGDPRIFTIGVRFWRNVIGSGQPYPLRPRLVTAAIYIWTLALFAQRISRTHTPFTLSSMAWPISFIDVQLGERVFVFTMDRELRNGAR